MADDNLNTQETIANLLIQDIHPYPEETRVQDSRHLMRLNDGKRIIRDCAIYMDSNTPGLWQLIFADALDYAGRAIFAFTGGVKRLVKQAGFFEALALIFFKIDIVLQPLARKFAAFFGQQAAEVVGGPWKKILAFLNPIHAKGTVKKESVILFWDILHARRIAKLVNTACVYLVENSTRERRYKIHGVLKQTKHQRRVRRTVRSRKPGNGRTHKRR